MTLQRLSQPAAEPLDIAAVRTHLTQDTTDMDAMIGIYQVAAREFAEHLTGRQIVAARWRAVFQEFPRCATRPWQRPVLVLHLGPLIRVVSVNYLDLNGDPQTLPEADYVVELDAEPARIALANGASWPATLCQPGAVWVDFEVGYAAPFVADTIADTITVHGWKPLEVGDVVRFSNSGGALPTPLRPGRDYWIESVVDDGVYTLAASAGGSVIDLTSQGGGRHFVGEIPAGILSWILLRTGSLFEHRAEVATVRNQMLPLLYVDRLLDPYRLVSV